MTPSRPPGLPAERPTSRQSSAIRDCVQLLIGGLTPLAVALLLIPAGRAAAWAGLLATVTAVGWFAGRDTGSAAGVTAGVAFMWVHGPQRFASTISDPWVIRLGLMLCLLGIVAAILADLWRHEPGRLPPAHVRAHRRRPVR
jgi:hypothetical protein